MQKSGGVAHWEGNSSPCKISYTEFSRVEEAILQAALKSSLSTSTFEGCKLAVSHMGFQFYLLGF